MADLKTNLLGFVMNSPVIGASGTVGYGVEYEELADFAKIGGISGKGLTLHGQYGNKGERKDLPLEALGGEAVKEGDILERAEDGWHIRQIGRASCRERV